MAQSKYIQLLVSGISPIHPWRGDPPIIPCPVSSFREMPIIVPREVMVSTAVIGLWYRFYPNGDPKIDKKIHSC